MDEYTDRCINGFINRINLRIHGWEDGWMEGERNRCNDRNE
jgi:hypothetical protein